MVKSAPEESPSPMLYVVDWILTLVTVDPDWGLGLDWNFLFFSFDSTGEKRGVATDAFFFMAMSIVRSGYGRALPLLRLGGKADCVVRWT